MGSFASLSCLAVWFPCFGLGGCWCFYFFFGLWGFCNLCSYNRVSASLPLSLIQPKDVIKRVSSLSLNFNIFNLWWSCLSHVRMELKVTLHSTSTSTFRPNFCHDWSVWSAEDELNTVREVFMQPPCSECSLKHSDKLTGHVATEKVFKIAQWCSWKITKFSVDENPCIA